ncbi:hypothetical protein VP01_3520g3 [Puccinia sorghi]|uniref:hAT-like transposase RNase-H fold domain-containing protein n=1 Tax=Puccinia sorghi TaxID=27349 RepID=A0A0L6UXH7_9BASI|nr:hypothetical protein VP01_3520g3 [Puccinia sorghi]
MQTGFSCSDIDEVSTKGNHFYFFGALVSFIDIGWNYDFQHLSLKFFSWNQKFSWLEEPIVNVLSKHGLQRKISSNKNTIAKTMHQELNKLGILDLAWECNKIHIKCFCHKMELVVNAGLNKLGLELCELP